MESRKGAEWESPLVARLGLVPGVLWQEAKDHVDAPSKLDPARFESPKIS
jgi:hypothetical protein